MSPLGRSYSQRPGAQIATSSRSQLSTGRPQMWSLCSWVMRIADRFSGARPMVARRWRICRGEKPASTRMRDDSVSM